MKEERNQKKGSTSLHLASGYAEPSILTNPDTRPLQIWTIRHENYNTKEMSTLRCE